MTTEEVLRELSALGSETIKNIFLKHGAREPLFGVKVEDLKKILKKVKGDQRLALELFETGNSDAMYLAGLMADGRAMTKDQLQSWAEKASWQMISEYTVAWVASESPYGLELALQWIDSPKENTASSGWATLSSIVSITDDEKLDMGLLRSLLDRVAGSVHQSPNRVKYTMNGFVISIGTYVKPLAQYAMDTGNKIGKVSVEMGGTACKVPSAPDYIAKVESMGKTGKKRKTAKC